MTPCVHFCLYQFTFTFKMQRAHNEHTRNSSGFHHMPKYTRYNGASDGSFFHSRFQLHHTRASADEIPPSPQYTHTAQWERSSRWGGNCELKRRKNDGFLCDCVCLCHSTNAYKHTRSTNIHVYLSYCFRYTFRPKIQHCSMVAFVLWANEPPQAVNRSIINKNIIFEFQMPTDFTSFCTETFVWWNANEICERLTKIDNAVFKQNNSPGWDDKRHPNGTRIVIFIFCICLCFMYGWSLASNYELTLLLWVFIALFESVCNAKHPPLWLIMC